MDFAQQNYAIHIIDLTIDELKHISNAISHNEFSLARMLIARLDVDLRVLSDSVAAELASWDKKE